MPVDVTIFTDQHRLGAAERALAAVNFTPSIGCDGLAWVPPAGPPRIIEPDLRSAIAARDIEITRQDEKIKGLQKALAASDDSAFNRGHTQGFDKARRKNEEEAAELRRRITVRDDHIKELEGSALSLKNKELVSECGAVHARVKALEEQIRNLKNALGSSASPG